MATEWQTAAAKANLGHVTAHDLRHSLVANAFNAGLTLSEAARLARHASPAVTATVSADVLEAKRETLGAKLAMTGFGADYGAAYPTRRQAEGFRPRDPAFAR